MRTAPQIFKTADGQIPLLRKAPTIRNLVLPGAALSGWVMPHALARMGKTFFDGVRNISGCSSGSLVAILLGSGMSPQELEVKMETVSIPSLFESIPNFGQMYPSLALIPEALPAKFSSLMQRTMRMVLVSTFTKKWQLTAQEFVRILDQWTSESVSNNLKKPEVWSKAESLYRAGKLGSTRKENEKNWNRLNFLKQSQWVEGDTAPRTKKMITFSDNALLHQVAPIIFKKITVTASKIIDSGKAAEGLPMELERGVFNAENTPATPMVEAGRFSMSIPLFCQEVEENGQRYTDGGLVSRNPAEVFYSVDDAQTMVAGDPKRAETLLFIYASKQYITEVNDILHKNPAGSLGTKIVNHLAQWFINYPKFVERGVQDNRKWHNAGPNVVTIDNGEIDSFDVDASKEQIDEANKLTDISVDNFLGTHKNQAWTEMFASVSDAVNALSEEEKTAVKEAGHPNQEPNYNLLPTYVQDAQIDFYNEVVRELESSSLSSKTGLARMATFFG